MEPIRRLSISLLSERRAFLGMPNLLISGGPLLSLLCSVRARHWLLLLVWVVDWYKSVGKADVLSNLFGQQEVQGIC